jgi:hypothetical protein
MKVLSDETWMRHANPLSVWTRYAAFPFLVAAIWSRMWLGWWALVPLGIVIAWLIWNPRAFPAPRSTNNWASKAVLGERVWLAHPVQEVPRHHIVVTRVTTVFGFVGLVGLIWGLYTFDVGITLLGMVLTIAAKSWFIDRMVWLFEDMKDTRPEYRSWLY